MLRSRLTPTRNTLGEALAIESVELIARSDESHGIELHTLPGGGLLAHSLDEVTTSTFYSQLYPRVGAGTQAASPLPATKALRPPVDDFPAYPGLGFASLMGIAKDSITEDISRRIWFDFRFSLALALAIDKTQGPPLVGGICFGGYPYLPYRVTSNGESSANFGLPREMRLSWGTASHYGFLDQDSAVTVQRPSAHSGVHLLTTGPVVAREFVLRISDVPRIVRRIDSDGKLIESWGFAIPYLFFLGYVEGTRYRPDVPAGLLCATYAKADLALTYFQGWRPATPTGPSAPAGLLPSGGTPFAPATAEGSVSADLILSDGGSYQALAAASLFAPDRDLLPFDIFVSRRIEGDDELRLFLEQAEEQERCLAGLRITFPPIGSLPNLKGSAGQPDPAILSFDLEIYELDPPQGVAPIASSRNPRSNKYAKRIFGRGNIQPGDAPLPCVFVRPTAVRCLALVFSRPKSHPVTVIALDRIELVQSAHVDIVQRPSRTQVVRSARLRVIGPRIGEDYAALGAMGFQFSVEHVVAGERRRQLAEVRSLLDFLQMPGARILANRRYYETTHDLIDEAAETLPGSHERRRSESLSAGWNRSEAGKDVAYTAQPNSLSGAAGTEAKGFDVFSSSEQRVRVEHVPPNLDGIAHALKDVETAIRDHLTDDQKSQFPSVNFQGSLASMSTATNRPWAQVWGPLNTGQGVGAGLSVQGLTMYVVPPIASAVASTLDHASTLITTLAETQRPNIGDVPDVGAEARNLGSTLASFGGKVAGDTFSLLSAASPLAFVNGFGISGNAGGNYSGSYSGGGIGVGASASFGTSFGTGFSMNFQLPTVSHNFTIGTLGSITKQADAVAYAYSQYKTRRYEDADLRSTNISGQLFRRTARDYDLEARRQVRSSGTEVRWQGADMDVLTCEIPIGITLPASSGNLYRTTDEAVRVRFPNGVPALPFSVDVSFDVTEEWVKDDH